MYSSWSVHDVSECIPGSTVTLRVRLVGPQGAGWSVTIIQSLFFKKENILWQH